ncbi:MAG: PEP-CTERM sorting domain-containing protein [Bryobacteraceae bacterium]|nr:PEP-CTERM sorting domain-containing protein [Bryobacteraceae bacterium]
MDALAQREDEYFDGGGALILGIAGEDTIFFQNGGVSGSGSGSGVASSWLGSESINGAGVNEVGALDLWGPVGVPDAEMYSEVGDPSGCAVLQVGAACRFTVAELAAAIGVDPVHFDLDGLMFKESNIGRDLHPTNPLFKTHGGKAPSLIFSIMPAPALSGFAYDGGEIWTYDPVTKTVAFLNQSGRIWNTAFDVRGTFRSGVFNGIIDSENITAIEASFFVVPEPGTMGLLAAGIALVAISRFRR